MYLVINIWKTFLGYKYLRCKAGEVDTFAFPETWSYAGADCAIAPRKNHIVCGMWAYICSPQHFGTPMLHTLLGGVLVVGDTHVPWSHLYSNISHCIWIFTKVCVTDWIWVGSSFEGSGSIFSPLGCPGPYNLENSIVSSITCYMIYTIFQVLMLLCVICKIKERLKRSWGSGNPMKCVNLTCFASVIPLVEYPKKVLQIFMTKYMLFK